jgi:hypothetical protein
MGVTLLFLYECETLSANNKPVDGRSTINRCFSIRF